MIPYARLTPGPGWRPKEAALYYAQRLAVWPPARRGVARLIAGAVNAREGAVSTGSVDGYSARVLSELKVSGVSRLAPLAPKDAIAQIYDYFVQQPVIGPQGAVALADLDADAAAAAYPLKTVLACPGLLPMINAASVLSVIGAYLGCKPTLSSLGVRWSFPTSRARPTIQNFHRDVDDWRFLKLFVYLTDVDEGSGPHTYVRTSHRSAFATHAQGYDLDELARRFGPENIDVITGERGTTFLADTIGVHRGGGVATRPRLILQAQYSILPVYAFSYAPVAVEAPRVDPYVNRLLLKPAAELAAGGMA